MVSKVQVPERNQLRSPTTQNIPSAERYFGSLQRILAELPFDAIGRMTDALEQAYLNDRMVLIFGNGGSAALASHWACDLSKGTIANGARRFRVMSLTDNVPLLTAWANDASYEGVFSEQILNVIQPNDVAIAISGSGNSPNVLKGLRVARESGAMTLGLTGYLGGGMKELCDICVTVPSDNMQHIEDAHLSISHSVFVALRGRFQEIAEQKSLSAGA